ncbi:MAG: hypothetical protein K0S47_2190 [Herbinix sp.]|jgi:hypothetical protein|nr:hypothetical protein [Herbinix sp.]
MNSLFNTIREYLSILYILISIEYLLVHSIKIRDRRVVDSSYLYFLNQS